MKSFQVGDRIVIYTSAERHVGKVIKILDKEFYRDGLQAEYRIHGGIMTDIFDVKQCRRLVKKERRRIWIDKDTFDRPDISPNFYMTEIYTQPELNGKRIEFIEVRKKK